MPANQVDLLTTVLHEIGHGLGLLTLYDPFDGTKFLGLDDSFLRLLRDETTNKSWSAMTNAERLASQVNTSNLTWTGAAANAAVGAFSAGTKNGRFRMYAPNPVEPGSSVGHFDTALSPNELMEPGLEVDTVDYLAYRSMGDVGWIVRMIFKDGFEAGNENFW